MGDPPNLLEIEYTRAGTVVCPHCPYSIGLSLEVLHDYFESKPFACPHCKNSVDWFEAMELATSFPFSTFGAVGARSTIFYIELKANETKEIDFSERMIPPDSRVLYVNYTSVGSGDPVFPIELHGNSPHRHWSSKVHVYGRGKENAVSNVSVHLVWIPRSLDDASWESLVDAFMALTGPEAEDVIIPANIAINARVSRFFTDFLKHKLAINEERAEQFLSNQATYASQLKILLPLICSLTGVPPMLPASAICSST